MSDNWIVQNLENALETWNDKLSEIWALITMTPQSFKGGKIWDVIVDINGAVQSIGLALLVLFFVAGVVKTCGSFTDVKKPEHAMKLFVRFALAKGAITYGMELMLYDIRYCVSFYQHLVYHIQYVAMLAYVYLCCDKWSSHRADRF